MTANPETRMPPEVKAAISFDDLAPLIRRLDRERGLQIALLQTSFWPYLSPIVEAGRKLAAVPPHAIADVRKAIVASWRMREPIDFDRAISIAATMETVEL